MRATNLPVDPFVRAYLEAAEWAGIDDSGAYCVTCQEFRDGVTDGECECGEAICSDRVFLDGSSAPMWSAESLARATADCEAFQRDNAEDLEGEDLAHAGHNYVATQAQRNARRKERQSVRAFVAALNQGRS